MAIKTYLHALNVGQFDRRVLHRVDLERVRLAAERQKNFQCDAIGPAWARPGTEYIFQQLDDNQARLLPFLAGTDSAYLIELTDGVMRVLDCSTDTLVTRPAVTSAVTSGDFFASTGWTLASTSGQSSTISGDQLRLQARAHGGLAKAKQTLTVVETGTEHALRIVVERGPVKFRLGSTDGGAEYCPGGVEAELKTGTHSFAFTPAGNAYIEFSTDSQALRLVESCEIEAAGVMQITTPWPEAALKLIRYDQSLDVMFLACDGYQPMRIERRSATSWGLAEYEFYDGPFYPSRSAEVTLTPAATEGNTTLTADRPFFTPEHVGSLFRLFHEGQKVETYLAGANEWSPPFMVSGITETNFEERKFTIAITGTWSGTLRQQRAFGDPDGEYHDYRREQASATIDITANATYTNDDNDDNIDAYVRIGFPTGSYTSGEAAVAFSYGGGGGYGVARVTGYTSSTVVDIEVITPFKGKHATKRWREGWFSPIQGWPTAVVFNDGRLNWFAADRFAGSISDAYESFDEDFAGDAGPILRTIAVGGRNEVNWAMALSSLMIGADSRIVNARASSLDEILTPDNAGMKSAGKIGSAAINPAELADDRGVFVQASGKLLYEITWSSEKGRYVVTPFSKLTASLFSTGILDIDVQTLPDQRMWVTTDSSDLICIVFEPSQNVLAAHIPISTSRDGEYFESVAVVPGADQDRVYASVRRIINGNTVRYVEKFAKDEEALVGDICKVMDSHVEFGAGSAAITGLDHLEGEDVVAWADGEPVLDDTITDLSLDDSKVFTVAGGQITLPAVPTVGGCVGLAYDYQYKSARLALGVPNATPMLNKQSLAGLGLLLSDYVRSGVKYGSVIGYETFDTPNSLPLLVDGEEAEEVVEGEGKDEQMLYPGSQISFDTRICISGRSPKPMTILGLVVAVETHGS